jgi:Leucine-rich repeat (LRR) protein
LPDGTLDLGMSGAGCKTLAPLQGLRVSVLDVGASNVTDLSPLSGQPLRKLDIHATRVSDLSPLAQCPELRFLRMSSVPVRDLSPLKGLPLVVLIVGNTNVSDITALAGMPLKALHLDRTRVTDLRPLLACPTIEWLTIPTGANDVGKLRALKKLVRLSERHDPNIESPLHDHGGPAQTAKEFWKEYDAQKKGEAK